MSEPCGQAGDGIIRTTSGGLTYAPDGHPSNANDHAESYNNAESSRSSSNGSSARFMPIGDSTRREDSRTLYNDDDIENPTHLERRNTYATIDAGERGDLHRILSTQQSALASINDPSVDPQSPSFDLTKFLKLFRHLLEEEGIKIKEVGIVYKNLNVYGSGAALQLQKTVVDFLLAPLRIGEWFSFGKKEHKQILHNFDGVVRSGELLVVLGRPGSGCSTLLKTMCGELHGLDVGDGSVIHYNGIPQKQMMKEFKGEAIYNQEVGHINI